VKNKEFNIKGEAVLFTYRGTVMDDTFLSIRKETNYNNGKGRVIDICPICMKHFREGDKATLAMTNNKLFPNKWVHDDCLERMGEEKAAIHMAEQYERVKRYIKIWG